MNKNVFMSDVAVIIVAAGKSTRFNDKNDKKPFVSVNARALWLHSVDRFRQREDVKQLIVVIAEDDQQASVSYTHLTLPTTPYV